MKNFAHIDTLPESPEVAQPLSEADLPEYVTPHVLSLWASQTRLHMISEIREKVGDTVISDLIFIDKEYERDGVIFSVECINDQIKTAELIKELSVISDKIHHCKDFLLGLGEVHIGEFVKPDGVPIARPKIGDFGSVALQRATVMRRMLYYNEVLKFWEEKLQSPLITDTIHGATIVNFFCGLYNLERNRVPQSQNSKVYTINVFDNSGNQIFKFTEINEYVLVSSIEIAAHNIRQLSNYANMRQLVLMSEGEKMSNDEILAMRAEVMLFKSMADYWEVRLMDAVTYRLTSKPGYTVRFHVDLRNMEKPLLTAEELKIDIGSTWGAEDFTVEIEELENLEGTFKKGVVRIKRNSEVLIEAKTTDDKVYLSEVASNAIEQHTSYCLKKAELHEKLVALRSRSKLKQVVKLAQIKSIEKEMNFIEEQKDKFIVVMRRAFGININSELRVLQEG